jgi:hypothetical protein
VSVVHNLFLAVWGKKAGRSHGKTKISIKAARGKTKLAVTRLGGCWAARFGGIAP